MTSCHTTAAAAVASFAWILPVARAVDAGGASVLRALYNLGTHDDSWFTATNWPVDKPCTNSWYGVTCVNGAITMLSLPSNNVGHASIATQFGLLTTLTVIRLRDDAMSHSLPTEIGMLTKMISIDFTQNTLTGTIPTQLGLLTELTGPVSTGDYADYGGLSFGTNQMTNTVPTQLGRLTKLSTLMSFSTNKLTGPLPTELGNLQIKSGVLFYYNGLSQTIPTQLGRLTLLSQRIALDHNSLKGSIPTEIGRMTAYETSKYTGSLSGWLDDNSLTGTIPSEFANLKSFSEGFYLRDNCLSGTVPSQLGEMTLLEADFDMANNGFWGPIPTQLGSMTAISTGFYVEGNVLSQQVPTELGRLSDIVANFDIASNQKLCGDLPTEVQALSSNILTDFTLDNTDIGDPCPVEPSPKVNYRRCASKDDDEDGFALVDDRDDWIWLGLAGFFFLLAIAICIYYRVRSRRRSKRARENAATNGGMASSLGIQLPMPAWKPAVGRSDGDGDGDGDGGRARVSSTHAVMEQLSSLVAGNDSLRSFLLDFNLLQIEARPIAAGGAGQVYRGTYSGDVVAIKTVYSQMVRSADVDDICHEASLLAQIHNPRFVRLYGIALKGPIVHVVTEYVDHTLLEWFEKSAPGADREGFCAAATQLLEGIDFIHQRGISHRDLKPQNVLMTADAWNVKICDLGMSRAHTAGKQQTMTVGVGSPLYMPPEAILDEEEMLEAIALRQNSAADEDSKVKKRYDASAWGKQPSS